MSGAPAARQAWPVWAQDPAWLAFTRQLAQYYTNRSGTQAWTIRFQAQDVADAYVLPSARVIVLSPTLIFPAGPGIYRRRTFDRRTEVDLALRALIAHEAGHVRFSCAKPEGEQLGMLWNILEDERIERRMAHAHRHARVSLVDAFDLLGDVYLTNGLASLRSRGVAPQDANLLWWALVWRWAHDQPLFNHRPRDPRWADVRPLVEAAWVAETSEDVVDLARQILQLIGPDEAPEEPLPVGATGAGSGDREEQARPGAAPAGTGQKGEAGQESGSGPADPGEDAEAGPGDGEDRPADDRPGPDQQDSGPAGPGDEPEPGQDGGPGGEAEGDAADEPDSGAADEPDSGAADEPDSGAADEPDSGAADEPANPGEAPAREAEPAASRPDAPPDGALWEEGRITEREPAAPPSVLPAGQRAADLPAAPKGSPLDPVTIESMARLTRELLQARTRPGLERPSHTRGRYSYDRQVAGLDRTFLQRSLPTRLMRVHVSFVGDRSLSMSGAWGDTSRIRGVHAAASIFARAAQLDGTVLHTVLFDDGYTVLTDDRTPVRDAAALIHTHAAFRPTGCTLLHPALEVVLRRRIPSGEHHLIVIACDGELDGHDRLRVHDLVRRRNANTQVLPLLIGHEASLDSWREVFPGALATRSPADLVRVTQSVIAGLRRGPWRARPAATRAG